MLVQAALLGVHTVRQGAAALSGDLRAGSHSLVPGQKVDNGATSQVLHRLYKTTPLSGPGKQPILVFPFL